MASQARGAAAVMLAVGLVLVGCGGGGKSMTEFCLKVVEAREVGSELNLDLRRVQTEAEVEEFKAGIQGVLDALRAVADAAPEDMSVAATEARSLIDQVEGLLADVSTPEELRRDLPKLTRSLISETDASNRVLKPAEDYIVANCPRQAWPPSALTTVSVP